MLSLAAILDIPDARPLPPLQSHLGAEFPEWFTLRGRCGVFRVDKVRSCGDMVVIANANGREVGRCSHSHLRESIYEPA